jgi:hypothetical protein
MKVDPAEKCRYPVEPADPGPIHAWLYSANPGPPIDWFRDDPRDIARLRHWILGRPDTALLEDGEFVRAACGRQVRVIYRHPFNTAKVGVCLECASMAELWQTDPSDYDRLTAERNERWAANDRRRHDEEYYAEEDEVYGAEEDIEDEDD